MMVTTSKKLIPIANNDKISHLIGVLQDYILNGDLKPGMEIPPERQMASELGVSRFSLREALRVVQVQGLIEISRGRRPRVAKSSAGAAAKVISLTLRRSEKALLDLIEARQSLECGIARFAALRAKPFHIKAMKETIADLKRNKGTLGVCVAKDVEFHSILVKASGNRVFEIMLAPLAELLRKSRTETMRLDIDRAITGHESILSAVIGKDSDKAVQAMHNHLEMAEEDLKKVEEL